MRKNRGESMKPKFKTERVTYPCNTKDCDGIIGEQSQTGLCPKCYRSVLYYTKKNATDVFTRAKNLHLYMERLSFLLTDKQAESAGYISKRQMLPVLPGKVAAYRRRTKYKVVKK